MIKRAWGKYRSLHIGWQAAIAFIALCVVVGPFTNDPETTATAPAPKIEAGNAGSSKKVEKATTTEPATTTTVPTTTTMPPTTAPPPTAPPVTQPPETATQMNARRSAAQYLDYSPFSRKGLIDQLVYEQFGREDATYAVDAVGADWNEQAAKSAAKYLEYSSFSRNGLVDQLIYEGFTPAEAQFGVSTTGL